MLKLTLILIALFGAYSDQASAMDLFSGIMSSVNQMLSSTRDSIGGSSFGFTSSPGGDFSTLGGASTSFSSSSGGFGSSSGGSTSSMSGVTKDGTPYILRTTEVMNGNTLHRTVTKIWTNNGTQTTKHYSIDMSDD